MSRSHRRPGRPQGRRLVHLQLVSDLSGCDGNGNGDGDGDRVYTSDVYSKWSAVGDLGQKDAMFYTNYEATTGQRLELCGSRRTEEPRQAVQSKRRNAAPAPTHPPRPE